MNKQKHTRNHYDFYADMENIKDAVFDATKHAKGKASDLIAQSFQDAKYKTDDIKETVAEYVAEKPYKSLGIALLSGVVLGFLLRK